MPIKVKELMEKERAGRPPAGEKTGKPITNISLNQLYVKTILCVQQTYCSEGKNTTNTVFEYFKNAAFL